MLSWITENLATVIVCAALIVIVTLIIVHMIKDKKKGRTSCGCNCAGCPMSGSCHHGK